MASVIETAAGKTVNYRFQSGKTYYLCRESSFLVLPDGKTLVAPLYNTQTSLYKTLYAEDITTRNACQIGTHSGSIRTILYDQASKTLFAGNNSGHIVQYQKSEDSTSFSQLKSYGNVGLICLSSSTLVKNLAIFGGSNKSIIAIDIDSKEVVPGSVTTPFTNIYTLTPCEVSGSRTLLSVGGDSANYSDTCTDIFEMHFEGKEDEENTPTSTNASTTSGDPLPEANTFPGVPSQDLVNVIISGLRGYVKELFSDFTRVYLEKLKELQGKFY
ncbi:MAG: hypothetical protein AAFO91_10380 [Bacteroidota bacterium]